MAPVNIDYARETLSNLEKEAWNKNIINVSKLRTYTRYKQEYVAESHVHNVFNQAHRSIFDQFGNEILPLNPLGTGDLIFYQSQGLSTFWGPFF